MKEKTNTVRNYDKQLKLAVIIITILEIAINILSINNIEFVTNTLNVKCTDAGSIINPIITMFLMLAYINMFSETYKGVIELFIMNIVTTVYFLIQGCTLNEAITYTGSDLPISVLGLCIMEVVPIIAKNKQSTKERFSKPKYVKPFYKIMAYSVMFSVLMVIYRTTDFGVIKSTELKLVLALEIVLPTLITISYITFTDIGFWLVMILNTITIVTTGISIQYNTLDFNSAITSLMIAAITYKLIFDKIKYMKEVKSSKEVKKSDIGTVENNKGKEN